MSRAQTASRLLAGFALIACTACGGDKPGITDPDDELPVDTAAVNAAARTAATNALLGQIDDALNALSTSLTAGGVPTGSPPPMAGGATMSLADAAPPPPPPDAAKCTFDDATVRWDCPSFTQPNGMVIKSWFQFLDAQNVVQKEMDTLKIVAIRRATERSGNVVSQHTSQSGTVPAVDTMSSADTLVLSGLRGTPDARRLDGSGGMSVVIVPEGQPVATVSATITTARLALNAKPGEPHYPIAGTITAIVKSVRADQPQAGSTTTQVTSYDGTTIAKLVITAATGQLLRTCTWDMTSAAAPACTVP
jgi:hypothetical protein